MLKFRLFVHDLFFFPPHFNLGVLENARLDIFKSESHAFRTHDSLEWERPPFCFLTLISQTIRSLETKLGIYRSLRLLVQELVACILLAVFLSFPLSAHHSQSDCQQCLQVQPIVLPLMAGAWALFLSLCSWPGLVSQKHTPQNMPVTHLSPPWDRIPFLLCIRPTPAGRWDRHGAEGEF